MTERKQTKLKKKTRNKKKKKKKTTKVKLKVPHELHFLLKRLEFILIYVFHHFHCGSLGKERRVRGGEEVTDERERRVEE